MLACARIGAMHSIVFGCFSSDALADRIVDATCTTLITCNGNYRGDKPVLLKPNADEAMAAADRGYRRLLERTVELAEAEGEAGTWLHPRQVLRELERAMPARAMVSTDIGNINSVANSYLRFEEPRSFFAPMSWGNCGYALPTVIGAKKAAPDRPAISYAGDGAWAMSMSELMTAVRHNIPVTAIVFHNRQWGAEKKNQVDFYGRRFVAGELEGGENYSDIAKAMGAEGVRVDQLDQVGPALTAAVEAQMNDATTTVVEIMCTKELGDPFRKDALKTPTRYLDKYKDYV